MTVTKQCPQKWTRDTRVYFGRLVSLAGLLGITMHYVTRPAIPSDLAPMMALAHEGLRPHYEKLWNWDPQKHEEAFCRHFTLAQITIIVVDANDVGYLKVEDRGDHRFLDGIYIDKNFRSQGIGRKVIQDLIRESQADLKPLRLRVMTSNPAQALYRRLGFKVLSSDRTHIDMEAEIKMPNKPLHTDAASPRR